MKIKKQKKSTSKNVMHLFLNLIFKNSKKKLIITFFCMLFFSSCYSQKKYNKLPKTNNSSLIVIINDSIISSESFISNHKETIEKMYVMKEKPNRKEHKFYNLSENGIVLVDMNKKVKTISQQELNSFFKINPLNEIYVNGYLIEHRDYEIATESIVKIEFIQPNTKNDLKNKTINIWMTSN